MPSEVAFKLSDPSYRRYTWLLQDEHNPASQTPLISTGRPAMGPATQPTPDDLPERLTINGYTYLRTGVSPIPAAFTNDPIQEPRSVEDLTRWRQEWIPQVDKLASMLEGFDPTNISTGKWAETLEAQDKEFGRVFAGVHRTAVLLGRMAAERFLDNYTDAFGEHRRGDGMALLQGFPNRTLDRANSLWELSRILRTEKSLQNALDHKSALPNTPVAARFREAFDAMLREFGDTTDNGMQDMPTWREESPIPMAIIRAYAKQDDSRSPHASAHEQRERRMLLEEELRDAVRDPSLGGLVPLMHMAQQFLPNLEDHNLLCDQRCHAASRARWLAIGEHLRRNGTLSSLDDIFFYTRSELLRILEGEPALPMHEVAQRRRLQQLYRASSPPLFLGKPEDTPDSVDEIPTEGTAQGSVRGVAASPGSHRGRARIIESLEEAGTLQDGEILVVRSTTPAWTPFFGVIGALVSNTGGALSHAAVVAREFGIPAVVGTSNGTALIPDGAIVTVDGTAGLVVLDMS